MAAEPFQLPKLPFEPEALAPVISSQTLSFHHGKHHKAYIDKTNELVKGKPYAEMSLEEIVRRTFGDDGQKSLYQNAGQAWNHDFYWKSLSAGLQKPSNRVRDLLEWSFGGFDLFKKDCVEAAVSQFGSGWVWLVMTRDRKLKLTKTANADSPLTIPGETPLLVMDVWEHAYYLDYQNRRNDHIAAVVDKLLNWEFVEKNFFEASSRSPDRSIASASMH